MKKKTILGLIAIAIAAFSVNLAKADTESTDSGGGAGGNCEKPMSNVCYKVKQKDGTYTNKPGVLHIRG
ncbi:hypothetical protein [Sphingobacterium siyangense]|uniref:hypothetical protein n=1 Tax=Sphingobacterium siyangense TaxID=459529 RepID=UPI001963BCE2|nr:hypothetical protein [Sphingobacterium siyangense]QRY57220.1 hypothetical protein JVX97_25030 [Sphingobacterium siyangense]